MKRLSFIMLILLSSCSCDVESKSSTKVFTLEEKTKIELTDRYKLICTNDLTVQESFFVKRCENEEIICYGTATGFQCKMKSTTGR